MPRRCESLQGASDALADEHPGIRAAQALLALPLRDRGLRYVERLGEGVGVAERLVEIGLAEIGEIRVVAAAKRVPVGSRRRDGERAVVLEGIHERA